MAIRTWMQSDAAREIESLACDASERYGHDNVGAVGVAAFWEAYLTIETFEANEAIHNLRAKCHEQGEWIAKLNKIIEDLRKEKEALLDEKEHFIKTTVNYREIEEALNVAE